nr:HipA domain-containing protein [Desulfobacula sp.]
MGALIYAPTAKHEKTDKRLDLEALAQNSRQIVEGEAVDILPALMKAGGSPGGARPKILAGIIMPETRLFESGPQNRYFGIKRFDRKHNHRFHVHTFGNLIHSNFRTPEGDYETFLKVVLDLTKTTRTLKKAFAG